MTQGTPRPGRNPEIGCPTRAHDLRYARIAHLASSFHTRYQRAEEADCWLWDGYMHPLGYGRFGGRNAHRIAWVLASRQDLTGGDTIDHLCFERRCVNPSHLERVTHGENVRRARERQHGGILTREQALARKAELMRLYRARKRGVA